MKILPIKHPSAWLPPLFSLVALALVLGHFALYGAGREPDEGAAAHLFQLLLAAQLPVMAYFAIRWLPRFPAQSWRVLLLQTALAVVAIAAAALLT